MPVERSGLFRGTATSSGAIDDLLQTENEAASGQVDESVLPGTRLRALSESVMVRSESALIGAGQDRPAVTVALRAMLVMPTGVGMKIHTAKSGVIRCHQLN